MSPSEGTIFERNVTYFQFQFHFWSAFIARLSECERSDFRFFDSKIVSKTNFQQRVNVTELCTKAFPRSVYHTVNAAEFIGDKNSLTNKHRNNQLYILLVQIIVY